MEPNCTSRAFDPLGDGTFAIPLAASIGTVVSETHSARESGSKIGSVAA
jgi:hypothetical protein